MDLPQRRCKATSVTSAATGSAALAPNSKTLDAPSAVVIEKQRGSLWCPLTSIC